MGQWPTYRPIGRRRDQPQWWGPRRVLTLDEQMELKRLMAEAKAEGRSVRTAQELAPRYGVSTRTVWRYCRTVPVPPGMEVLRMRLSEWAKERDLDLTFDDMATLLLVIERHRDKWLTDERVA